MTPAEQKQQELDDIEKRRRRKEALLLLLLLGFYRAAELEAIGAVGDGTDPGAAADVPLAGGRSASGRVWPGMAPQLANAMAAVHIEGAETAARQMPEYKPPTPKPAGGVAETPQSSPATPTVASKPEIAAQYRPFANRTVDEVRQNVRKLIDEAVENVGEVEATDAAKIMARTMREVLDSRGYTANNPVGARALSETLVTKAWSSGSFSAWRSTGLWVGITGFEHITMDDGRVCPICRPRHHLKLPRDHPYWLTSWGCLHYRCRCLQVPIWGPFEPSELPTLLPPADGFGLRSDLAIGFGFNGTR